MKKLIFILFAFLAITAMAQTTPSYPTVKLTKPATGAGTDEILTIGASKNINKVSKASLLSGVATTTYVDAADATKAPIASPTFTGTVSGITKVMVGLGSVDNTSDTNKPISTATQTALDTKQATLVSGTSIKTINGNSLLGSGDIVISGGGSTAPLEFNTTDLTVWNNGKSNIITNTSFGDGALKNNTSGFKNTSVGYQSLMGVTTGQQNTSLGYYALRANNGDWNVAIGSESLKSNTTGSYNVGISGLSYNTLGSYNIGINGLSSNTTGTFNVGINGLSSNTTGSNNVGVGYQALYSNITGNYNIGIGFESGMFISDGVTSNSTSTSSIFIGTNTFPLGNNQINQIVIGDSAIGAGSNTATLGNTSILKTVLRGTINTASMPVYADNAAATAGGLSVGDQYRTSTGQLMVRY